MREAFRNALWDALVDCFGPVTQRGRAARGAQVTDLAELLQADSTGVERTPEAWREEVNRRYAALVDEWGVSRVTSSSFVTNWSVAGKIAHGVRSTGNNVSEYERYDK
jgi:hypothetical protein